MFVSSTPLRMSFFGGGSDIPQYYKEHSGMVLSTAIDRRINIAANLCDIDHIRVIYSKMELTDNVDSLKHDRVREALKMFHIDSKFEMCSFSDISTNGTGLGSSSTFTVGLVHALAKLKGMSMSIEQIAQTACEIEIDRCRQPIGKQDQYAAAYGGFNVIYFDRDERVEVVPMNSFMSESKIGTLNDRLMCFSTNKFRSASNVLKDQVEKLKSGSNVDGTHKLVDLGNQAVRILKNGNLDDFGSLLHEGWLVKKQLAAGISNPSIDEMYETGIKAGAFGGKLLGAGGGGYLLFYVPAIMKYKVREKMASIGCFEFKFNFTHQGTTVTKI